MIPNLMIPRYASQFRIEPGSDPLATATEVVGRVEDWVGDVVDRGPLKLPLSGGNIEPAFGCRVALRLDDDRGGWTLDFRREEGREWVVTKVRLRVGVDGIDLGLLEVGEREPTWPHLVPPAFVGHHLEFDPVRLERLAGQLGGEHRLGGGVASGGVGEDRDVEAAQQVEDTGAGRGVDATHGHGREFGARGDERTLEGREIRRATGSGDEAGGELAAGDPERVGLGNMCAVDDAGLSHLAPP